jgi:hypothetical protein
VELIRSLRFEQSTWIVLVLKNVRSKKAAETSVQPISEFKSREILRVTMAKSTFDGFVEVVPLINHVTTKYMSYQPDEMSFFASLCKTVKSQLSPDFLMSAPVVQNTHEFMHVLRNVPYHSVENISTESTVDLQQLIYEIVAYCSEDIAAYIPYI